MKAIIIAVADKLKDYKSCIDHLSKMLSQEVKIKFVQPSSKQGVSGIQQETQRIVQELKKYPREFKVLLDQQGKQLSSEEFAKFVQRHSPLVFVIGWSWWVDKDLLKPYIDFELAISKFTLNHLLALVVLLEQLFRAKTINQWGSYHH